MLEAPRPWLAHYDASVATRMEPYGRPLFSFLDDAARRFPDRPALRFQNTLLTYRQLKTQAEKMAGRLRQMGVQPGDRVAVMLPNLPQTMLIFWAILKAGGVAVMLNPLYMESEVVTILNDAGPRHMVLLDLLWTRISALRDRLPVQNFIVTGIADALSFPLNVLYRLKELRNRHAPRIPYDDHVISWRHFRRGGQPYSCTLDNPQDTTALLQYTGGTTGLPKGVPLTHGNLGANALQVREVIRDLRHMKHSIVGLLPFFHVYGLCLGLTLPAMLAATTLPLPRYVPQDVLHLIDKYKPTIFPGAPSVYASLLQQKNLAQFDLKSILLCISGSAPLPHELRRQFHELTGASLLEGYGLTEASPITHLNPLDYERQKDGSIGMPMPGTDAMIVADDSMEPLPPHEVGELLIRGPQVMHGYWNRPEDTAAALKDGWLHTGDMATMDEDGFFYIVDRKKDLVLVGGYNVYPREVEEIILEHPQVHETVCVGLKDPLRGEVLKCFVVPQPGTSPDKGDIISWCRSKLANYKVPRLVEFREELPKSAIGKILRRELRDGEEAGMAARHERKGKAGHHAEGNRA
ncbi:long-chain fatty acid--CoA ligase [uncultured Desulfovibrio sp.]|uniref:long-chain-fatty-acid--CoA ligase n=1 Tax=uncultured Desulfovibrio sp. TaxID=167968 RepID=UPI0026337AC2|nr:long-chain fatty acid--CoA ligase [uncultured Desulfovibrio sp.]